MLHDDKGAPTLQDAFILATPGRVKMPKSFLENAPLEVPNFAELLNHIRLHMPWEPSLPSQYYNTRTISTQAVTLQHVVPTTTSSGIPGATHDTGTGPKAATIITAPPTIKTRGTIVRKTTPINPAFQKFVDVNLRVRDVLQRAGPSNRVPNNSGGVEMCLSYHMKGVCNSNCARHLDHKEHQPAEDQSIVSWCERNYKPE
jgi:hypothetical protein